MKDHVVLRELEDGQLVVTTWNHHEDDVILGAKLMTLQQALMAHQRAMAAFPQAQFFVARLETTEVAL